jgi:hypothetical protein
MKVPNEGDRIVHHETFPEAATFRGVVDWIGASQFVYVTDDGERRFCMFSQDWKVDEHTSERKSVAT